MPKRYIIEWDPPKAPTASSGTSTAHFKLQDETEAKDDCPKHPRSAAVENGRRKDAPADKNLWTCQEIHDILGVDLKPKPAD